MGDEPRQRHFGEPLHADRAWLTRPHAGERHEFEDIGNVDTAPRRSAITAGHLVRGGGVLRSDRALTSRAPRGNLLHRLNRVQMMQGALFVRVSEEVAERWRATVEGFYSNSCRWRGASINPPECSG